MLLHEEAVLKLREMFDTQGRAEFEIAARNLMFACAALINHVSGPSELQDLVDALPVVVRDGAQHEASRLLN